MPNRIKPNSKSRLEIAAVAAKLVAIEGVPDFQAAKKKAALQLGLPANKNLPTNLEVESALKDYQSLFQSESHDQNLIFLRQMALKAMQLLSEFRPLLSGPVAKGTATPSSEIVLHLYHDQAERIGLFLEESGIPVSSLEQQIRFNRSDYESLPAFRFFADRTPVIVVVLPNQFMNVRPLSTVDNRPMTRLTLPDLEILMEDSSLTH